MVGERTLNVLVVGEDDMVRKLLVLNLETLKCNVTECADGIDASDLFKANDYDIVFIDLVMPCISGINCCLSMREYERNCTDECPTPIIGIIGDNENEETRCTKLGVTSTLRKPVSNKNILDILGEYHSSKTLVSPESEVSLVSSSSFDYNLALEVLGNNENMFLSMVNIFLKSLSKLVDDLHESKANNDAQLLREIVHILKTRALYVGGNHSVI